MKQPRSVADVARAKLTALPCERGDDGQRRLTRYAIERRLYRLGVSPYRDRSVLKGAGFAGENLE